MKVLFFANTDWYLYNFRLALAEEVRARGNEVILVSPSGPYAQNFIKSGFRWIEFHLGRKSINPLTEIITILRLITLYRRERPDLTHHFTVKCVLYGSIAAYMSNSRVTINAITGLGYALSSNAGWVHKIVSTLYGFFLKKTWVVFQNPEDHEHFVRKGWADPSQSRIIRGSGVDVDYFVPQLHQDASTTPLVILPARMLWTKGVGEFIKAASLLKEQNINARLVLVGETDPGNPDAVTESQIQEWQTQELIEYWGWQSDMRSVYTRSTIVCLPSYREGLPKTLLEAAACGRALIASDVPGCREIVKDGYNGLLIPQGDGKALAHAIQVLLKDPVRRNQMALNGRALVVKEFSTKKIVSETLEIYSTAAGEPK